jgi:hypothetical protein
MSEAARQIGISRQSAYRALKIAGLSNEARPRRSARVSTAPQRRSCAQQNMTTRPSR